MIVSVCSIVRSAFERMWSLFKKGLVAGELELALEQRELEQLEWELEQLMLELETAWLETPLVNFLPWSWSWSWK